MKIKRAFLLRWHWRIGAAATAFLLLIALTGLVLNHARLLNLDNVYLEAGWILSAYNMDLPEDYIQNTIVAGDTVNVETLDGTLTLTPDQDIDLEVARQYRGPGITLEKFILDLHTGQLVGLPGKILSDLAALAIIFLCATGLYNLIKRKRA